jgi:hypothetical protein
VRIISSDIGSVILANPTRIQPKTKKAQETPSSLCDTSLVLNMNTRIFGSGIRFLRVYCSARSPIQFLHSSIPRNFSSTASRLYASMPIAHLLKTQLTILGNVKRYTEQHEWIEIDGDDIGRSDNCTCF